MIKWSLQSNTLGLNGLECPVTPVWTYTGVVSVLLVRPALIISSEPLNAALASISKNKEANCNWGQNGSGLPWACLTLSPHLDFWHWEKKRGPPWPVQTSDTFSPELGFPGDTDTILVLAGAEGIWGIKYHYTQSRFHVNDCLRSIQV